MSDVAPFTPNLVEEQREKAQRLRSWVQAVSTQTRARSRSPNSESPLSPCLLPKSAQPSQARSSTSTSETSSTTVDADWCGYEPNLVNAAHCAFGNTVNPSRGVRASTAPQNMAATGSTPYSISPLQGTVPPLSPGSQAAHYAHNAMMPYQNIPQRHLQSRVGMPAATSLSSVRPPMTLDTAIPGPMPAPLTKLMPTQPPRPEPIYVPGLGSQVYPNSTTHPSYEHRPMLQAATHFFQDQSPASSGRDHHHHHHRSRRPRSASHPRAIHREDIDTPESKSRSIPKSNRNRREMDRIPLPADYIPVSRAYKQSPSSARGRDTERSVSPSNSLKAFLMPILEILRPPRLTTYRCHTTLAAITQATQPPRLIIAATMAVMHTTTGPGIAPRHSRPRTLAITTKAARPKPHRGRRTPVSGLIPSMQAIPGWLGPTNPEAF